MYKYRTAFCIALLAGTFSTLAVASGSGHKIQLLGLFKNMAVLNIDHRRTVMHVGDKVVGDIKLLAANSERALFEIKGHQVALTLSDNSAISTDYPDVMNAHQAQLISSGGMYSVTGAINGQLANFMVDTGASYVTMSPRQASALHLDYHKGRRVMMNTANGTATAHIFVIRRVRIGGIELHNVGAAVMSSLASSRILLGMSFLSRVDMKHGNGLMVLKQRF